MNVEPITIVLTDEDNEDETNEDTNISFEFLQHFLETTLNISTIDILDNQESMSLDILKSVIRLAYENETVTTQSNESQFDQSVKAEGIVNRFKSRY